MHIKDPYAHQGSMHSSLSLATRPTFPLHHVLFCFTGGADGTVLQWDVSDGTLQESRFVAPSVSIPSPFGPGDKWAPCI
eukprot:1157691-Pelagomonas_calceolata.AAC.6